MLERGGELGVGMGHDVVRGLWVGAADLGEGGGGLGVEGGVEWDGERTVRGKWWQASERRGVGVVWGT